MRVTLKRRRLAVSIGAAVGLHLAVGLYLIASRPTRESSDEAPPENVTRFATNSAEEASEPSSSIDRDQLRATIDARMGALRGNDPEKLVKQGERAAEWLESRSSVEAVSDIGAAVRDAYKIPARAYAPADPPPPGEFDYESMLPYSVWPLTSADGSDRLVYTWVDARGRSMEIAMAPEASDPALTKALQMAQRSAIMRQLFQTSVLPVLESQLRRQRKQGDMASSQPPTRPVSKSAP